MDGRHAMAGAMSQAYKGMEPVYYKDKDIFVNTQKGVSEQKFCTGEGQWKV